MFCPSDAGTVKSPDGDIVVCVQMMSSAKSAGIESFIVTSGRKKRSILNFLGKKRKIS